MKEPREALYEFAGYMQGRGLALTEASLFNPQARTPDVSCYETRNPNELDLFKDRTFDYIIIGDPLATFLPEVRENVIQKATQLLKAEAYLLLALPTNTFDPSAVETAVTGASHIPTRLCTTVPIVGDGDDNDSWNLLVFQLDSKKSKLTTPVARRVCISRLGAIGDMIQCTPLIRQLKKDGFHVTVNCSPYSAEVLKGNTNVDKVILQERNIIPNQELGKYWAYWRKRYHKYINLSETIEGPLLKVQGRRDYYTSKRWRSAECNVNYFKKIMECGGYTGESSLVPELNISARERSTARRILQSRGVDRKTFVGIGVLNGSSHHKVYPILPAVLNDWLAANPDSCFLLLGDKHSNKYAWEHPKVINLCGQTSLREAFALVSISDVIVGPETSLTNAAACFPEVAKIVFLSHSSPYNLTYGWKNTQALTPSQELSPCYPCHQLHYTLDSCPQASIRDDETKEILTSGPRCAMGAITGERVYAALDRVKNK